MTVNADDEKIKVWILEALKRNVVEIVKSSSEQQRLAGQLVDEFFKQCIEDIKIYIKENLKNIKRAVFQQSRSNKLLSVVKFFLEEIKEKYLIPYINSLTGLKFDSPSSFNLDCFENAIRAYMKEFYVREGFIRDNGRFQLKGEKPNYKCKTPLEKIMVKEAYQRDGRQSISHVSSESLQQVFNQLLEDEMIRDNPSVIEKHENYRLKPELTRN